MLAVQTIGMSLVCIAGQPSAAVLGVTAGIRYIVTDVISDGAEQFYVGSDECAGDAAVRLRGHVMLEYKGVE